MAALEITDKRLFERRKEALREQLGVELEQRDGRYLLASDGYAMPALDFTASERAALVLALGEWRGSAVEDAARAVRVKLTPLGLGEEDQTVRSGGLDPALAAATPGLEEILAGIAFRRNLSFSYVTASTGVVARRTVQPWRLARRGKSWYLVAFDETRGAPRVFKLDRIRGAVVAVGPMQVFEPPPLAQASALLREALGPGSTGTALVEAQPAPARVLELEGATRIEPGRWRVEAAHPAALAAWGAGIEVLEPDWLRQQVRDRWEGAAKAHLGEGRPARPYPRKPKPKASRSREDAAGRAARMVSLVSYLAASGVREPLGQLAERFDVSAATVKEDLMLLWTEVGAGPWGGQLLDFDWSEDFSEVALLDSQGLERPVRLSPVEAITLITALRSLEQAAGVHEAAAAQTARAKLEAALGPVDVAEVALPAGGPALQGLREAIDQKTRVAFEYVDGRGGSTQRQVDPLGLFTASDHWLLAAWDLGANAERYFRVDRITQLELLPHPATAHPYQPHPSGWSGDADMLVDVIFAASERWRAEELETPLPPLELPGGSLQIRLAVSGAEWVTRLALSGGGAVEVLGPPDLRARIANAARAALGGGEPTSG